MTKVNDVVATTNKKSQDKIPVVARGDSFVMVGKFLRIHNDTFLRLTHAQGM